MKRHTLPSRRSRAGVTVVALVAGALATGVAAQQLTPPTTGTRTIVLLFDVASMSPEEIGNLAAFGVQYVDKMMTSSDMVAVATTGARLNVVADFTSDNATVKAAVASITPQAGAARADSGVGLRGVRTLCETLAPIQQKKAVLYFGSGTQMGNDDPALVRDVTGACNRGNVSLYPVDARGLAAAVAGGGATTRSSGGQWLFTR
jgi:VWFA-related protein